MARRMTARRRHTQRVEPAGRFISSFQRDQFLKTCGNQYRPQSRAFRNSGRWPLAGWNVRRVEIPWVRWCSECATAEHPFKPVRTSFHTVCLGVKHPSHRGAPWCNGATARRRLRVLRVTCNACDVQCRPWSTTMRRQTAIQSAIDGFICHALGPVEDQS